MSKKPRLIDYFDENESRGPTWDEYDDYIQAMRKWDSENNNSNKK